MIVDGQLVSLLALVLFGVGIGFVAGLFGVGGGFLLTPLLTVVLGIPLPIAIGCGLCQMIATATVSLMRHQRLGQGELRFDWLMLLPSIVGAAAGAHTVTLLHDAGDLVLFGKTVSWLIVVLYGAYIVFLVGSGVSLRKRATDKLEVLGYLRRGPLAKVPLPPFVDLPTVGLRRVSAVVVSYVGLGLGYLSGLLGVGGGIALMPTLLYGFGFPLRQAAGTGIFVLLVTSIAGTVAHARQGHVHLEVAMVLAVGATLSAQLGALTTRFLPPRFMRRGLMLLIGVTLFGIVYDLFRQLD